MLTKIQIAILILSLMDLTASFFYVSTFHAKYPDKDYTMIEANPVIKMALKLFGVTKGMLFGGAIVFGIVVLLAFSAKENLQLFMAGMLTMMNAYHWLNFRLLKMQ